MKKLLFILLTVFLVSASIKSQSLNISTMPQNPYFIGNGGRGTSLAVLKTKTDTLQANEQWLSSFIQSILTSNFKRYTAMTVVDRLYMDSFTK